MRGVFFMQITIENYIESCVEKGLSVKTYSSYEQTLTLFATYLRNECDIEKFKDVEESDIKNYVTYLKERGKYTVVSNQYNTYINKPQNRTDKGKRISDVTINNYLRNLNAFFNYLVESREIKKNPMARIKKIKVSRKPLNFIDDKQFKRLMTKFDISKFSEFRDYTIVLTLSDTGMRIGECLNIKITDVNFKERYIFLPAENTKGKKSRYVFFSDNLAKILRRWVQYQDRYRETDYLFSTNQGKALGLQNFEKNIKKYADRAGIENLHPHMFRNNFAKRFLMSGGDIYTLSRILGHSSITVTENEYLDLDVNDLRKQYQSHSPLSNMKIR